MAASEVDRLVARYEDKMERAWQEWQIGGSMRHEALYRRYEEVVDALRGAGGPDGRALAKLRSAVMEVPVGDAGAVQDLKNRIVRGLL